MSPRRNRQRALPPKTCGATPNDAEAAAWLTRLNVDTTAGDLRYDLAVDASGNGNPSPFAAGLTAPLPDDDDGWLGSVTWPVVAATLIAAVGVVIFMRRLDRA